MHILTIVIIEDFKSSFFCKDAFYYNETIFSKPDSNNAIKEEGLLQEMHRTIYL